MNRSLVHGSGLLRPLPGPKPALVPSVLAGIPAESATGGPILWTTETALGPVPVELGEVYPVGALVSPSDFRPRVYTPRTAGDFDETREPSPPDWTEVWTARHVPRDPFVRLGQRVL